MKRKYTILAFWAVFLYILLIGLLVNAESASPDASITGPGSAVWYSLTTLTTVGYGDTYPVTPVGRVIGAVFQLMSIGVLVTLISTVLTLIRGRLLPLLILCFQRKRHWYIFAEINSRSLLLAEAIAAQNDPSEKKAIIFSDDRNSESILPVGVKVALSPQKILEYQKKKGPASVFAMSDSQADNDRLASALADYPCRVFAMSSYEPDRLSDKLILFNPAEICARLYWQLYPVIDTAEAIVLVGTGKDAEAILEQAILSNVLAPDQHLTYHVFGDFTDFRYLHPYLEQIFQDSDCSSDVLIFHAEPWNTDLELLKNADRIIFCDSSVEISVDRAGALKRACPVRGRIFVRGAAPLDGIITFGNPEDLFSPELTMRTKLNKTAVKLHNIYHDSVPGSPAWEELSGFLRRSNIASADHLAVKIRILLGEDAPLTTDTLARAASVYEQADEETKELCRRIEHERWMRFHLMNNWQYAPKRDNAARLHPLLLPYGKLSRTDQLKDDYAWKLLEQLASK